MNHAVKNWPQSSLRFNELYERSDQTNPNNFFHVHGQPPVALSTLLFGDLFENLITWYEERLARLDDAVWEQLLLKALPHVCEKDTRRGWAQLWNHLNESLGYVLLADRGYRKIQFIDCGDGTTPDLLGETGTERVLVEVKTVNNSECDIDLLKNPVPVARDVIVGIGEPFKQKLRMTINDARVQLCQYGAPTDKRIVFLVIHCDSDFKFVGQNYKEIGEFVASCQTSQIEVAHQIIN
jgi:hypothetical protein